MRFPKPWTKKRGGRILGGAFSGAVGEAVFFAAIFLAGVFALALTVVQRLSSSAGIAVPPEISTAVGGGLGFWIVAVLAVAMLGVGAGGLAYRLMQIGASDERRSMMARHVHPIEIMLPKSEDTVDLPAVPQAAEVTDSPGVQLAYRLPSRGSIAGQTLANAALALLWNAAWLVLLAVVISGFLSGRPRWVLTLLLVPFAAIGAWAFRAFFRLLRRTAGVGATLVEISDHPLVAGGSYQLWIRQTGRLALRRLRVELICEEETTYSQGTDIRIDRHVALSEILLTERDVRIDPHRPWEQQLRLELPAGTMHSFRSAHNAVCWKITVSGDSRPWPSFCRHFPVVVHPQAGRPIRLPR